MQGAEIDEDIDQGVAINNGLTVAKFRAFNSEGFSLGIDAFIGGTLVVETFISLRMTVKLITDTSPDSGRHRGQAASLEPIFVVNRTS